MPPSGMLTIADCVKLRDAIDILFDNGGSFLEGMGDWADYFYRTGKFSKWGIGASHNHPRPWPNGGRANDIIVFDYSEIDGPLNDIVRTLCHEISHSKEWGIDHFSEVSNYDVGSYCYDLVTGKNPPDIIPLPPPPPAPG